MTSTKTSVVAVEDHEVELAEARAVVARDERVAEALEVGEGEVLAEAAEVVTQVGGHDGDARSDRVTWDTRSVPILRSGVP